MTDYLTKLQEPSSNIQRDGEAPIAARRHFFELGVLGFSLVLGA